MKQIQDFVLSCIICQKYSASNPKQPMTSHDVCDYPFQKIGIDFKDFKGIDFLVVVDYFSKFIIVNRLKDKTGYTVISVLKNICSSHGLPQEIFSDCGPPFGSKEFRDFANRYKIKLGNSSPRYPRSNGMVERHIQVVKALFSKVSEDNGDLLLAVLDYNTAAKEHGMSPSEILMGRKIRNMLPVTEVVMKPNYPIDEYKEILRSRQLKQKQYYDRQSQQLPDLNVGEQILVQDDVRKWAIARLISENGNDSFTIQKDGKLFNRNRQHLRPLRSTRINMSSDLYNEQKDDEVIGRIPQILRRSNRVSKPPDRLVV